MSATFADDTDPGTDRGQDDFTIGDIVDDREAELDELPVVINLPPVTAEEWDAYRTEDGTVTVADDNPGYDPKADVVVVMFPSEIEDHYTEWEGEQPLPLAETPTGTTYAFPPGRLEAVGVYTRGGGTKAENSPDGGSCRSERDDEWDGADKGDTPSRTPTAGGNGSGKTLREQLDTIAATVAELNVDAVAVDTFREAVIVEKLGQRYAIDTDGNVDEDDPLADRLEAALSGGDGE